MPDSNAPDDRGGFSWPAPRDEEASRRGVEGMLDLIEDGIHRGII